MIDKEILDLCEVWFQEIAERCSRLTSGNVSHNGKAIRGLALNAAEFIDSEHEEPNNSPKIKGWVARDKDGELNLFYEEPRRSNTAFEDWFPRDSIAFNLPREYFYDIKWESNPIEVELTINRVK